MILHSGGASGADYVFAERALLAGLDVIVHSFCGHKPNIQQNENLKLIKHSNQDLSKIAFPACFSANEVLKRRIPLAEYSRNLILRDFFQIYHSQYVFAVAKLADNKTILGGTGWAIEMAIQKKIPIVIFNDNIEKSWFYFNYKKMSFEPTKGSPPLGFICKLGVTNITGIGTRNISQSGIDAISSLFAFFSK